MPPSSETRSRSSTPSHYPYYGVRVTDSEAQQILACSIPQASFLRLTALPDGTYYNNRVYKIQYTYRSSLKSGTSILKVCGRARGREKPRNEVHVLRLIEATRPCLPVPRVIAWSGQDQDAEAILEHAWILLTLLERQSLDTVPNVNETDCRSVFEDVAGFLTELRMPFQGSVGIGNLVGVRDGNKVAVLGAPVESPSLLDWPKKTFLEYITALLKEGLALREIDSDYANERDLIPSISAFIDHTLPHLPIFCNETINLTSVLSNCDLSAQNVLVTRRSHEPGGRNDVSPELLDSPLRLSGIVDWEYAGFFSPVEEYLTASPEITDLVPHPDDEIGKKYASCLFPALMAHGIDTPHNGAFATSWHEAQLLHRLRENIVPWWVHGLSDSERASEIKEASRMVRTVIEQLLNRDNGPATFVERF